MQKIFAVTALVVAIVSFSAPAFAMAEFDAPWVEHVMTPRSTCGEGDSYILEGEVKKGTKLSVQITMTAVYSNGRRVEGVEGTPAVFTAAKIVDIDRNGKQVTPVKGVYKMPRNGAFRVLAIEANSDDALHGRVRYENYHITVCPVR